MVGQSNNSTRQWRMAVLAILAGAALVSVPRFAACAPTPQASPPASVQSVVSSGPFTLTAAIDSPAPEGQPAMLALTLRNIGSKEQYIGGSAFEKSSFKLVVTDEKGHAVPKTISGEWTLTPPIAVYANGTVIIKPGQTLQYRFNLARLFDLSRPGTYAVSVQRILAPYPFPVSAPKPGTDPPPNETSLTAGPLKFRMEETAIGFSGLVTYVSPPVRQTFLYMASTYNPRIARYRVGVDGGLSLVYDASAGHSAPSSVSGAGPSSLVTSADGRFLYAGNTTDNTVSQYRIGNDGVLSPLPLSSVPAQKFPGLLLIDPKGQFLYALSNWGDTRYTIGPDGRLTVAALMPSEVWGRTVTTLLSPLTSG